MAKQATTQAEALTQAHVVLMENEILSRARTPNEFRLVNNQYNTLQSWHDQYTGWRIRRTPAVIRLIRTPVAFTPGYAFRTLQQPRDFACFVWLLWYSETRLMGGRGNENQFLMSHLAERLEEHSATGYLAPHVAPLDFKRQADRYSLARALKALHQLGGLQLVDGSSEEWVEQKGQEDALWEFAEPARSLILALDTQQLNAAGKLLEGNPHFLNPARLPGVERITPLQRAWRTLLLGPVLLKYDDPEAFAALQTHAETVSFELGATFGWQLDLRYEHAMVIRASGTSLGPISLLNLSGAADQAALLCCDVIRQKLSSGLWRPTLVDGCFVIAESEIADIFRQVREQYGQRWGNTARKTSFPELLRDVYATLRQAGLLRGPDRNGNMLVLPTVARFAVTYSREDEELESNPLPPVPANKQAQLSFGELASAPGPVSKGSNGNGNGNGSYNTVQAGKILGVSNQSILNWLRTGFIGGERYGRGWLIPASEVERIKMVRWGETSNATEKPEAETPAELKVVQLPPTSAQVQPNNEVKADYTVKEAARMVGIHEITMFEWLKVGKIKGEKRGQIWAIPAAEVERARANYIATTSKNHAVPAQKVPAPKTAEPKDQLPADGENYTVKQVAEMLGVVPWTVLRWIQQGRIQATNNGKIWLIPVAEAEKLKS